MESIVCLNCLNNLINCINELGQEIKRIDLSGDNDFKVTIEGLSKGIYFIKGTSQYEVVNRKIVVN